MATARTEEVPSGKGESKHSKAVCHPCIPASVDLPTTPESDGGGDDHEDSAERVQWPFHWAASRILPYMNMSGAGLEEFSTQLERASECLHVVNPFGKKDRKRQTFQLGEDTPDEGGGE